MSNQSWLTLLQQTRAIAVIRSQRSKAAKWQRLWQLGNALIEIAWNSDASAQLISQLRSELPCTIGTGTLLTLDHLEQAIAAGRNSVHSH